MPSLKISDRIFVMKKSHLYLIALIGVVIALGIFGLSSQKNVVLRLEGQELPISTNALLVKGALKSAGIELQAGDLVVPGPNSLVRDGAVIELARAVRVVF